MTIQTSTESRSPRRSNTTRHRVLTVVGATLAALALWSLIGPLAGVDIEAQINGSRQPIGVGAVIFASILAGLAGWSLVAVLERWATKPRRAWTIVSTAVLLVSLAGPLGSAEGTASMIAMVGFHVTVGAVLIPGMLRSIRRP